MKKKIVICFLVLFLVQLNANQYELTSPNSKIKIQVKFTNNLSFNVMFNGKSLLEESFISMELGNGTVIGKDDKIKDVVKSSEDRVIIPEIKEKAARIIEKYNELKLVFEENFAVVFRAYNEGVSYRFETFFDGDIIVNDEKAELNFAGNYTLWWPKEKKFNSNNQVYYHYQSLAELSKKDLGSLPILINTLESPKIVLGETDLLDYPGMWFNGSVGNKLTAAFPTERKKTKQFGDRDVDVIQREKFIAKTKGERTFPWRFIAIAENDGELITNQLSYLLASPCAIEDPSWIKTGKVAWDWWNANNVYNVDFRAGINTETYKYYIDFAAKNNIEYVILDEGWYVLGDLLNVVPEIDMEELIAYGNEKGVGLILWVVWKTLDDQLEPALEQFEKWGVKGMKIDFMDHDDQWMVNYYHKVAKAAADKKLLVNFHGAYKPAGLRRKYPNVLTREGVNGGEQYKWSLRQTPEHNLITPFSRMVAGPMDYTPGAMNNAQKENFKPIFNRPMSMGTRCHQLAMYVCYESPLQMLCDCPSNYEKEPVIMEFLSQVPVVWDETVVLAAKASDYLVVARRNGDSWYIGGMSDWDSREIEIDLSFLGNKNYEMSCWQDGINADRCAIDYKKITKTVTKDSKIKIKFAPGGGFAAVIK